MARDAKMLQQVVRCLSERKGGPTALKRRVEMRREYLAGKLMEARAAVDREFRRQMQTVLETHLAPKHRWVLRDLMEKWGWPSRRGSALAQPSRPCGYFPHKEAATAV